MLREFVKEIMALSTLVGVLWGVSVWSSILGSAIV